MRLRDFVSLDVALDTDYEIVTLYYDSDKNILTDVDGYMYTTNLFNLISPNDVYLLRTLKEDMYIMDKKDELWYAIIYS